MARWYGHYLNQTVTALEAATTTGLYERKTMTNGATLFSNMAASRASLSSAFYGQLDADNLDGSIGLVVPSDGYTRPGSTFDWTNLYINAGAAYSANRASRPTAPITVAGSTAETPADSGSISDALYTAAIADLEAAMADMGVRDRLGLDPWRTLASLYDDIGLTYLAWDDFTPGTVQSLTAGVVGTASLGVTVTPNWTYQYANDANTDGGLLVTASMAGLGPISGTNYSYNSGTISAGPTEVTWDVNGGAAIAAGDYTLEVFVTLYDAVIPAHAGTAAYYINTPLTISA